MNTIWQRLRRFNKFWDNRFEDLTPATWLRTTYRDFSAGLVVALTAIPMAMGFAMAMGLRPEQGIIAGALACIIGRTWGGSKYQVYGPTAAFIPIIAALMTKYGESGGGNFDEAHGFLVLCSIIAGVVLLLMGLFGVGRFAAYVPNSIVVGFTVGIAVAIALSNINSVLGLHHVDIEGHFVEQMATIFAHLGEVNLWALGLAMLTLFATRWLLKVSIFNTRTPPQNPHPTAAVGLRAPKQGF
ncbi:MAG: hypothetical protein H0T76_24010 [Nannocystis sp.]|nr:SulP family inorganic anion transporter [Nannocystis sp.]MBA3549553.1 hypothetical protein [Nannocystis sp.]